MVDGEQTFRRRIVSYISTCKGSDTKRPFFASYQLKKVSSCVFISSNMKAVIVVVLCALVALSQAGLIYPGYGNGGYGGRLGGFGGIGGYGGHGGGRGGYDGFGGYGGGYPHFKGYYD
ncbi:hypothetical protein C0Q70_19106 [Pomacea canaliculata]|uniref:Uncharacterized protein n=1 Tax=Pomacea canaliculata TaxID=400727 RepID=A0A2T7NID8_POMCA|nr:hypothetical protein C0Q70_19106 [Pomacea canaliculata]